MAIERVSGRVSRLAAAALALGLGGCLNGLLYTDVTRPLMRNLRGQPVGAKRGELDTKQLQDPLFTGISVSWDSNAIGDIAKEFGMTEVYSADLRTVSVLFGLFGQETVIVLGK